MLNELYTLQRSLETFNVPVEEAHPWVKPLKRAEFLIVGVDSSGFVAAIEYVAKNDAVKLFSVQESNQANFPAVNWPAGVWGVDPHSAPFQGWEGRPTGDVSQGVRLL